MKHAAKARAGHIIGFFNFKNIGYEWQVLEINHKPLKNQ
jgi:hypothetical protein